MKKRKLKNLLLMLLVSAALTGCNTAEAQQESQERNDGLIESIEVADEMAVEEVQTLQPVEAEIKTGADFYALEKIPVGEYKVEGAEGVTIKVEEYGPSRGVLATETTVLIGDEYIVSFDKNVVLVKTEGQIYVYGDSSNREISRICLNDGEYEGELIWTDFPSQDIARCNYGVFGGIRELSDIGTLGETQTSDGFWKYAVYVEGEEMAAIKTEKQLFFKGYEGIAVNEDGDVYMLYYSSEPWTLKAFKVDMSEKVDLQEGNWITTSVHDFNCSHYGFSVVKTGQNIYIIKTSEDEAYERNGMDNLEKNLEPLEVTPTFEVVKAVPENFDSYRVYFDWYCSEFILEACLQGPEHVIYYQDFHLTEEVEKHFLGIIIPKVEENNQMWDSDKVYESYQEAQTAIKKLNKSLDKWEKENSQKIQNFFLENPGWVESYPEEAARFDVYWKNGEAVLIAE